MDTSQAITHLGLCAGYGGIELGLKRAIPSLRTIALCEIEAFAIANLVSKMEAGLMDPAPIWPDLKTFPWAAFRDRVDILTGGYPCQPFSAAGQRKGKQDPRHLWPFIADGIRLLKPKCCFFENVEGHISLGLSDVIEDLAGMGYRTTWGIFSASECGAPHQRKRVFILAVASGFRGAPGLSGSFPRHEGQSGESDDSGDQGMADSKLHGCHHTDERSDADGIQGSLGQKHEHWQAVRDGQLWPSRPGEQQYAWEPPRVVGDQRRQLDDSGSNGHGKDDSISTRRESIVDASSAAMADSHCVDRSEQAEGREHDRQAGSTGEELGDTEGRDGLGSAQRDPGHVAQPDEGMGNSAESGRQGSGRPNDSGWEVNGSTEPDRGRADWFMEPKQWQTQPPLGGDPDGPASGLDYAELCVTCDNRTDELRLLGNGVVPATAERAFRSLMQELDTIQAVL